MLNHLTIVIITYKRYGYLKRLLGFYSSYQLKARFLVLDSSPDYPNDEELINLLSQNNVSWKRYGQNIFFAHKIAEGCKYIETEYAVLCADDDFLIPTALDTCIDYLGKHPDYASAHGLYFLHSRSEKGRNHMFRIVPLYNQGRSSEENTSIERVAAYLSGQTCYYSMYAVHHVTTFRIIWNETKKYISDEGLSELFPSSISFIYGKMKILPIFYCSREPNDFNWYYKTYEKWYARMYSKEKLQLAVTGLSKHMRKVDDISFEKAEKVCLDAFQDYISWSMLKIKRNASTETQVLIPFLRRIKQKLRVRTRIIGWIYFLRYEGCHPTIYPKYLEDFKKVKKAVLSAKLDSEELNKSRKELAVQAESDI